jgi:ribosome biogenesis protein MAK21
MRADVSAKRCAAFVKRLLQCAALGPPAFACGVLLLVSEVLKKQPSLWTGVLQPEDVGGGGGGGASDDDDGNELFHDAVDSDDGLDVDEDGEKVGDRARGDMKAAAASAAAAAAKSGKTWPRPGYYDINKR